MTYNRTQDEINYDKILTDWSDMIYSRTPDEIKYDKILADWRKHWTEERYCYSKDRNMFLPRPLYDADVMDWQEGIERSEGVKLSKEIAEKHKATLLKESIEKDEEAKRRYQEISKYLKEKYA